MLIYKKKDYAICKCDNCGKQFKIYLETCPDLTEEEMFEKCNNCYHDKMIEDAGKILWQGVTPPKKKNIFKDFFGID